MWAKHVLLSCALSLATVCQAASDDKPTEEPAARDKAAASKPCRDQRLFVFSWPFKDGCEMAPRGGTTRGMPVELDPQPHPGWLSLQQPELSKFERDRRAILAMAGPYRTTFDFIETMGFTLGFEPDAPYQSWATEYVYVVEERKDFISLQHIIVMFFQQDDEVLGPAVVKHWRQDWQYEKNTLLTYAGNNIWEKRRLKKREVEGTWAQSVYQVDDSPRYASYGQWEHQPNFSRWRSQLTWRPLPRREFSVRDDYQVLAGYNAHVILPDGWAHEEENYKLRIDEQGEPLADKPYLAKEQGLNRYQRIVGHDFSAGDQYWKDTGDYWALVRAKWRKVIDHHKRLEIKPSVDDVPLFSALFRFADDLTSDKAEMKDAEAYVDKVFAQYLK